jgi:hypothetical protein
MRITTQPIRESSTVYVYTAMKAAATTTTTTTQQHVCI